MRNIERTIMKDFVIEVYDGKVVVYKGSAIQFIKDNDNDEDVVLAVKYCGATGMSTYGGGASADFEFVKCE